MAHADRPLGRPVGRSSILLAEIALLVLLNPTTHVTADEKQKRALVFYPTRREAPAVVAMERLLPRYLRTGLGGHLDYYSEFLDVARFPDPVHQAALRDFLRTKYRRLPLDLIITTSDVTLEFVAKYSSELFPDVPVVFLGSGASRPHPNSTGLSPGLDLRSTIDIALKLQPGTKHVFVVAGTSEYDRFYETLARQQLRPLEKQVAFTYPTGQSLEEVQRILSNLPADSLVYYLSFVEDGTGRRFQPVDSLDRITATANAPVYCWHEVSMEHGVVGGSLQSAEIVAQRLGELALRVLRGEQAARIPVVEIDANVNAFDWRQLRRWRINEDRLPPNSVVRFRQPSFWEAYKLYVVVTIVVLFLQTALIAGLLVNRVKLRRAEAALRESENRYGLATAASGVGVWDWNIQTGDFYMDPELKMLLGYEDAEMRNLFDDWERSVHPDDRSAVVARARECVAGRAALYEIEHRMLHKDGSSRWFHARGSVVRLADGRVSQLVGTLTDITMRKQADQALRESEAALRASYAQVQDLAGRLIVAQEAERTRIARDLHDDISQQLAGLSIALSGLNARLRVTSADQDLQRLLASAQQRATGLADEIRHLSHELHPGVLQHAGLVAALRAQCGEFQEQHAVTVTFDAPDDIGAIDPEVAICVYRIAQETLRNISKHAQARHAHVALAQPGGRVVLTITDDGRGFDLAQARAAGAGLGLRSIDERVRLARGTVTIDTQPQHGTRVQVNVPLGANAPGEKCGEDDAPLNA